ncbi:hypothetical protein [Bacillus solitudinis]|nr:hypothetical protein [Bacillus solitudinis]
MEKQSSSSEIKESLIGLGVGIAMMIIIFLIAHYGLGMEFFPA